jgi:phosphoribosylformylglycinamidine cyclo-ligase
MHRLSRILDKYDIFMVWYIVGGAQTKILHFVENLHHKDNLFPVPPLFTLIQEQSKTDWRNVSGFNWTPYGNIRS